MNLLLHLREKTVRLVKLFIVKHVLLRSLVQEISTYANLWLTTLMCQKNGLVALSLLVWILIILMIGGKEAGISKEFQLFWPQNNSLRRKEYGWVPKLTRRWVTHKKKNRKNQTMVRKVHNQSSLKLVLLAKLWVEYGSELVILVIFIILKFQ